MAAVTVRAAAPPPKASKHRKVTLTANGSTVTFAITNPEVLFQGLADEWATKKRPGRRPLLQRVGEQLRTIDLEAKLTQEQNLIWLAFIARGPYEGRQVALGYSKFESSQYITATGFWVITDLRLRSLRRAEGSNRITRADVSITLTEASFLRRMARPGARPGGGGGDSGRRPRRHTVKRGDTLMKISRKYYGTTARWKRIARANKIRDARPRKSLKVGKVLKIP